MYRANLKFVPEILAIEVLYAGCDLRTSIWGREGHTRSRKVPFERALVGSYRTSKASIITFPLSLRVSEILPHLRIVFQCATFPIPPPVSRKFSHVSLGVGGWPLGYEERRLIVHAISFQDFQCVVLIHQRYKLIDGRTDGRTIRRRAIAITRIARFIYEKYLLIYLAYLRLNA